MFKIIAAVVTAVLLALLPAASALSADNGTKGSKERAAYCSDVHSGCLKVYCDGADTLDTMIWCTTKCQQIYGSCLDAARGSNPLVEGMPAGQSAGVLAEEGTDLGLNIVNLPLIAEARLESACTRVPGAVFALLERGNYGCVNHDCDDKGGFCTVTCVGGKCSGFTPGKQTGNLTIIGILQNGDNIDRSKPIDEPGGGGGDDSGGEEEPECNGGCGVIL